MVSQITGRRVERIREAGDLSTDRTLQGQQVPGECCDLEKEMLRGQAGGSDLIGHDENGTGFSPNL